MDNMDQSPFSIFPNEVLAILLKNLSPMDINNLLAIDPIAKKLHQFIVLFKDTEMTKFFNNVPSELCYEIGEKTDLLEDIKIPRIGLVQLFEITNLNKFREDVSFREMNEKTTKILVLVKDYVQDQYFNSFELGHPDYYALFSLMSDQRSIGSRFFNQVCVIHLKSFMLHRLVLDPSSFHMPNIQKLEIDNCFTANSKVKFDFKFLQNLLISGKYSSISESIDFQNIKTLEFVEVGDISLTKLAFNNLESLRINSIYDPDPDPDVSDEPEPVIKISWCMFPKLRYVDFDVQGEIDINRLVSSNLSSMIIKTYRLFFRDSKMKKVQYIELTSNRFPIFKNVEAESLKHIYINVDEISETSTDYEFFKQSPSLWVDRHPIHFLSNLGTFDNFEYFGAKLKYEDRSSLVGMKASNFRTAELTLPGWHFKFIPKLNAPFLKSLKVNINTLKTLDNMRFDYPNLEDLSLNFFNSHVRINGWVYPNLKNLQIDLTNKPMDFIGFLPNLETFCVTRHPNLEEMEDFDPHISINLTAPELVTYVLNEVQIDSLNLMNFPKLRTISAKSATNIIGGDLNSLQKLDVLDSEVQLLKLRAPNLECINASHTSFKSYQLDSGLNLPLETKRGRFGLAYNPNLPKVKDNVDPYMKTHLDKICGSVLLMEDYIDNHSEYKTYAFNGTLRKQHPNTSIRPIILLDD
ncbi:Internalin-I [Wickerhamomyces ciferrii]|uniref:Internalin-I n=1 Tax=Wickerhamomyces ciferrii (strain ATCC 14091 / BCRC 22168 / CBS 111 / JCM 3599 / NBRC 0793 / NRRL Y-1031 F-60-10) TaxID=1206466 RepID=K0KI26_WICCF|nr:Internalin-I [Wickerhamomyces ciferrii]CCH40788.1 Internalin-I [Wickerhamomyces ciferrii]